MRQSRENELLEYLSNSRKGFTWADLLGRHHCSLNQQKFEIYWPRKTLARLLKSPMDKGTIEKVLEPREQGRRGRRSFRYRIPNRFWFSWGCMVATYPAKKIGPTFFLGEKRTKAYSGKEYVRLFPSEAKRYREYKNRLTK